MFPSHDLDGEITIGASTNTGSGTVTTEQFILSDGTAQTVALGPGPTAYTFNKTGITSITLKQSPLGVRLNYIALDGKKLVDPTYLDTVLDTPVADYAVITVGTNGNLIGAGTDNQPQRPKTTVNGNDKNFYYEAIVPEGTAGNTHVYFFNTFVDGSDWNSYGAYVRDDGVTQNATKISNGAVSKFNAGDQLSIYYDDTKRTFSITVNDP